MKFSTARLGPLFALLALSALVGCAGDADSPPSSEDITTGPGLHATLTRKRLYATLDQCRFEMNFIEVQVPSIAAQNAINGVFATNEATLRAFNYECNTSLLFKRTVNPAPTYNEKGILSLTQYTRADSSYDWVDKTDNFIFDLTTGKRLAVSDMLTETGQKAVLKSCQSKLKAQCVWEESADGASSILPVYAFLVERSGIRFTAPSPSVLVPWNVVSRDIRNARLLEVAKSAEN